MDDGCATLGCVTRPSITSQALLARDYFLVLAPCHSPSWAIWGLWLSCGCSGISSLASSPVPVRHREEKSENLGLFRAGLALESVTAGKSDLSAQQNPLVLVLGHGETLLSHSVLFVFFQ